MALVLHVVDAFTNQPFSGNPAAVCVTEEPLAERLMQQLAMEMNLSETAFVHPIDSGFSLRWFTPTIEVDLCGHATLASAHTLWETGIAQPTQAIRFHSRSGWLSCIAGDDGWIELDFPAVPARTPISDPAEVERAIGAPVINAVTNQMDLLVELGDQTSLQQLKPDMGLLTKLPYRGIACTTASHDAHYDFVSRFFAPAAGVNEDPVTGSAHCMLGPYWREKTGNNSFTAKQISQRGGVIRVRLDGDRVLLGGQAISVSRIEWLA